MSEMRTFHPTVAIIGGGPAGMGCALWLKHMGFQPVIIEKHSELGGQARSINRINQWFLGQWAHSSRNIAKSFADHIEHESIQLKLQNCLKSMHSILPGQIELTLQSPEGIKEKLLANSIVIATGQRAKGLEVLTEIPGYNDIALNDQFGFFPLDHLDRQDQIEAKRVAVLGGGDNAYCTALDVAQHSASLTLIMRSQPRAQKKFQQDLLSVIKPGAIEEHRQTRIIGFKKQGKAIELILEFSDGIQISITVDWIFARFGFTPITEFITQMNELKDLQLDSTGYLKVDSETRTSIPFVYAIGDVTGYQPSSLVTAVAQGATAARTIEMDQRNLK